MVLLGCMTAGSSLCLIKATGHQESQSGGLKAEFRRHSHITHFLNLILSASMWCGLSSLNYIFYHYFSFLWPLKAFKICELWIASGPESFAAMGMQEFQFPLNTQVHNIHSPPFLCLSIKGLSPLCFLLLALSWIFSLHSLCRDTSLVWSLNST